MAINVVSGFDDAERSRLVNLEILRIDRDVDLSACALAV
jgi:hypothetical protein